LEADRSDPAFGKGDVSGDGDGIIKRLSDQIEEVNKGLLGLRKDQLMATMAMTRMLTTRISWRSRATMKTKPCYSN
jgi:hypothetical protein